MLLKMGWTEAKSPQLVDQIPYQATKQQLVKGKGTEQVLQGDMAIVDGGWMTAGCTERELEMEKFKQATEVSLASRSNVTAVHCTQ